MLKERFDELAAYNRWANRRLYTDAASLPDEVRKRPLGLFFSSIHGTLNHLLVADYIWMRRFTGDGPQPGRLDQIPRPGRLDQIPRPERLNQILHQEFEALRAAREQADDWIRNFVTSITDYRREITYQNSSGATFRQQLAPALTHFFNHQAHHRGQIHAGMTIVGIREPAPLDLLAMQRSVDG